MENIIEVPKKIKNRTIISSRNSLLVIYLKRTKTLIWKDICTPMFIAALFAIAKIWKCASTDEWVKKLWYIYTQWTITQPQNKWNLPIYNNMNGPWCYYAKWNKSDRERQILYYFTYIWNLKNKTNEQTETYSGPENKLVLCSEGRGGMGKIGEGD